MKPPALMVFALAVAACGAGAPESETSGIHGRAVAGPQCPVEIASSPCPDRPYAGTVVAADTATGEEVTAETDAEGRFRLRLAPGTYEVSIVAESSPPFAKPQTVTVEAGSFARITVVVDTGIR